jgi:hypothetical protein
MSSGSQNRLIGAAPPCRAEGDAVSATVLYMSTSLDGFIARANESPDNSLGDGSEARSQTT